MATHGALLDGWMGHREGVAIADAEGDHLYKDVFARAELVARAISGFTPPGSRIAVLASPGAAFVEAVAGVMLAGGCALVLSPLHPDTESRALVEDADAKAILSTPDLESRARIIASTLPTHDIRALENTGKTSPNIDRAITDADDALQLYTSGTTGRPKGAVLSHGNLGTQTRLLGDAWGWSARDTLLHALPLHHMHGLAIALFAALHAGATTRFIPFEGSRVWDNMHRATVFMGVPTMYKRLFDAFDSADERTREKWSKGASTLRLATSGSAALPVSIGEKWRAITGRYPLERFGMTEIGVGLTNPLEGDRKPGHVGLPLPTVEARIVDDAGKDAETGELWIRGPSVFARYFRREKETREGFVVAENGAPWFKTGDTVTRDADGAFKILGRTSVDILKSGGYKLSALEIEEALRAHPGVAEVAVVGVPDETWGDRVVACVIARAEVKDCTEETLRAFIRERLAPYKVPKNVIFVEDLPRNAMGKVTKPELSRRVADALAAKK